MLHAEAARAADDHRVDRATSDLMREQYGTHTSWAVWSEPAGRRAHEWVGDLTALDPDSQGDLLDTIHSRFVLIALNSGLREDPPRRGTQLSMFHDNDPRGRDFMLAEAIRGTTFWGSYLTDFFKGVPTRDGAGLRRHLDEHPETEAEAASTVRQELDALGAGRPLLVCLGAQVAPYVRRHLGESHRVVAVSHYSRAMTKSAYRAEFEALLPAVHEAGTAS